MTAYLTISVGQSAATARPLLASTDPDVVQRTVRAILDKVDSCQPAPSVLGEIGRNGRESRSAEISR